MNYDFFSRERDFGRIVFALTLDKKKLTERIIIARQNEARQKLEKGGGDVYCDVTRPLGSLLINFESDKSGEWNKNAATLRESYGKIIRTKNRWKLAEPVGKFLQGRYDSGEPSAIFAAVRTWDEYLNCYALNHGGDLLTERTSLLYKPFSVYADFKPWQDKAVELLKTATLNGESAVEMWYATCKRKLETVVVSTSLLPIVAYYLHKVEEWEFVFQHCKICGTDFLARSRHYELCSDKCRKVQAKNAKKEFKERVEEKVARGDKTDKLYDMSYQYWYNRKRFLERNKVASDKMETFENAMTAFCTEAKKLKKQVKRGEMKQSNFSNWLFVQQNAADNLASKINPKSD